VNALGGGLLGLVDRLPIDELPARYRAPLRAYLEHGIVPEAPLRMLLEGDLGSAIDRAPPAGLLDVCAVSRWLREHLPASCHGCRDQVQLWIVYVRRARGRALLASFDGGHDGDAAPEAAPQ
jgi:hypothetical protein